MTVEIIRMPKKTDEFVYLTVNVLNACIILCLLWFIYLCIRYTYTQYNNLIGTN